MTHLANIQLPILMYTLGQMAEQSDWALQGAMAFDEQKTRQAVDALTRGIMNKIRQLCPLPGLLDLLLSERTAPFQQYWRQGRVALPV